MRLSDYVDSCGLLRSEQAGFRKRYSTSDHVFALNVIIEFYLSRHKRLYCAFVDYEKAFDTVNRNLLWNKLLVYGINGTFLRVVKKLYENAKACVRNNQRELSNHFPCKTGVRQGDNLSPLLFALYVNDLENNLKENCTGLKMLFEAIRTHLATDEIEILSQLFVLLYADDTILMAEDEDDLQKSLNVTTEFCRN